MYIAYTSLFFRVENDLESFRAKGYPVFECVQQQGDILVVPESWGHAVVNLQDSVAVASEAKGSLFRLTLPLAYSALAKAVGGDLPLNDKH